MPFFLKGKQNIWYFLLLMCNMKTYPDSRFRDVRPDCDLFPGAEIRIPVPGEHGLELLQLLRREVGSLSSLSFTEITFKH